jgi:hypothetical protein
MRRDKPITEEVAHKIYGILIEHAGCHDPTKDGRDDHTRDSFVATAVEGKWTEWRFQGVLRFGGKVWNNAGRWYVSCYREDEQALQTSAIRRTNAALDKLYEETYGEPPRK